MKKNVRKVQRRASRRAEPRCWPLPPEWDTFIPPKPITIIERDAYMDGKVVGKMTAPKWNVPWLLGLESYVRSIVRDELSKANNSMRVEK